MKKKRIPKRFCNSEVILKYVTDYGTLHIVKHTQIMTGIVMYTLGIDERPLLTFDNLLFVECLLYSYSEEIAEIADDIISVIDDSIESEVFSND